MMYLWLAVGFVLLIKGADIFVEGSSSIAKILKVPTLVIGLTIVSMGTSAPEAAVSITASLEGSNGISFSNIVGSNVFNLLVVVGVCALIKPVTVDRAIIRRDFPICIGATLVLLALGFNQSIGLIGGIILLVLFAGFMATMVISGIRSNEPEDESIKQMSPIKSVIYILLGIAAVIFGGDLVVDSACDIAASFGMSESLIGLTIIAVGTSLPELVTSVVAARKGQTNLAMGNAIGSCIFNVIFILGITTVINTITVDFASVVDLIILCVASVLMYLFCVRDKVISRYQGAICVAFYVAYIVFACIRN